MAILHSDTLTLTIASGKITPSQDIYAGAIYDLVLTGATFLEAREYTCTLKPDSRWDDPKFTITLTGDDFTFDEGDLTAELNLNSDALISYLGSGTKKITIEIWDDTQGRPVAKSTLDAYAPVNRVSDTADQTQPRSYTNAQIDDLITAAILAHTTDPAGHTLANVRFLGGYLEIYDSVNATWHRVALASSRLTLDQTP